MSEKNKGRIEKTSSASTTQSRYIDSDGVEFSAQEIVGGFKPKRPYKLFSLSGRISDEDFGKTTDFGKKKSE